MVQNQIRSETFNILVVVVKISTKQSFQKNVPVTVYLCKDKSVVLIAIDFKKPTVFFFHHLQYIYFADLHFVCGRIMNYKLNSQLMLYALQLALVIYNNIADRNSRFSYNNAQRCISVTYIISYIVC